MSLQKYTFTARFRIPLDRPCKSVASLQHPSVRHTQTGRRLKTVVEWIFPDRQGPLDRTERKHDLGKVLKDV